MTTFHTAHIDKAGHTSVRPVEGRKFRVTIAGTHRWFFVHQPHEFIGGTPRISDVRTGLRVIDISHSTLIAHRGDELAAAKAQFKHWLKDRDEAAILKVVLAAKELDRAAA